MNYPRETREKHTGRSERGNLNNRTVLGRHRGVRGEGIKSQKCASVPACQQFSKIYTCVRARVYLWKLLARWHAGTPHFIPYLLIFYEFMSFYLHM